MVMRVGRIKPEYRKERPGRSLLTSKRMIDSIANVESRDVVSLLGMVVHVFQEGES
jgi:hypothetical protein